MVGALTQGAFASWLIRRGITAGKMREVVSRLAEILTGELYHSEWNRSYRVLRDMSCLEPWMREKA